MLNKRMHPIYGYWAAVGLAIFSQIVLAFMAYQALNIQIRENSINSRTDAIKRAKTAVETFAGELPYHVATQPSLPMNPPDYYLNAFPWPDSHQDNEVFARLAVNASDTKQILLSGLINADQDQQNFWNLLLAKYSLAKNDLDDSQKYLNRIIDSAEDLRMPNGFSLKSFAALTAAKILYAKEHKKQAFEWIQVMGELSPPRPSPASRLDFWPELNDKHLQLWLDTIVKIWSGFFAGYSNPGWVQLESGKVLIGKVKGRLRIYPGDSTFNRLQSSMQKAAGESFQISLSTKPSSFSEKLPYFFEVFFECIGSETSSLPQQGINRVLLGFLLALGTTGLAVLIFFGIRREQERKITAEQELFFRQTAHDLKTPLATIKTLSETLNLKRLQSKEQEERYFAQLLTETDKAVETVDSMLMAARLRTGNLEPRREPVSPSYFISRVIDRFAPRLENWTIEKTISADEPILADPIMFERLLVNLVENVLKHAAEKRTLSFHLTRLKNGFIELRIGDRGKGSAKDISQYLYSDKASRDDFRIKSGGLGLKLVKMIVDLHAGSLAFHDRDDGGLWVVTVWHSRNEKENA